GQYGENDGSTVGRPGRPTGVQQQDIATAQITAQALEDAVGVRVDGVVATTGPACQLQAELAQTRLQEGIAQTGRCPEVPRHDLTDGLDGRLPQSDFAAHEIGRAHV